MARRRRAQFSGDTEGQVLILFALASFVLVGIMALALDAGYLMAERRQAQAAADSAALAGGVALMQGKSHSTVRGDAADYAGANGVSEDGGVEVVVTGDSNDGRVEVDVSMPVQRFLLERSTQEAGVSGLARLPR